MLKYTCTVPTSTKTKGDPSLIARRVDSIRFTALTLGPTVTSLQPNLVVKYNASREAYVKFCARDRKKSIMGFLQKPQI